jgi:eukaryotic-like serine/threonine-protein kinase
VSLEGQQLGRYRLVRLLGSGGMGEVYLAEDVPIQRQVAIKVIRTEVSAYPNTSTSQEMTRLFQREARAIVALDHPHILPLYDYGEATINGDSIAYLVMPYRSEGSLTLWLRQRSSSEHLQGIPLSTQDVVHFVRQAAEALQHAHDRQIIHQDVKPANFLIHSNQENPNRPDLLLADFGIARFTTATASASHSVRGTPTYMAPEQMEGLAVPASDQYALAIMTYELLTGRPPFQGGLGQVMYQHFHTQPVPPSTLNPSLPADVDTVILHALAKKPEERFRSVSAFARAFQVAMQSTDAPTIAGGRAESTPDLQATLAISDVEALRGTTRVLTLPDGQRVSVAVPAGAYNGQLIRLDGRAISSEGSKIGALLITLAITPSAERPAVVNTEATTIASSVERPAVANIEPSVAASLASSPGQLSVSQRGLSSGMIILLVALALVVIVGSVGFAFFYVAANKQGTAINTSATASPQANATATTLAQANANATATTLAQAGTNTATSTSPTPTTPSDPYTHTGTLVLNDPLQGNSQNTNWMTGTNQNNATCAFVGGAYQSSQPVDGNFHACFALATDFSNFVYEVQMTIVSGYSGGILFRGNQGNSTFYYFRVGQDGSYDLRAYVDPQIDHSHLLTNGSSSAIHTGYNQANIITVVANGSSLMFYANHQLITSVNDSTLSHGQIGVVAYNQGGLATVVYNNVRVWTL